jgi:hypothetical protein
MKLILLFIASLINLLLYVDGCIKNVEKLYSYTYSDNRHKIIKNYEMGLYVNAASDPDLGRSEMLSFSENKLHARGWRNEVIFNCELFCGEGSECILQYFTYINDNLQVNHLYTKLNDKDCRIRIDKFYNEEQCKVHVGNEGLFFTFFNSDDTYIKFSPSNPERILYNTHEQQKELESEYNNLVVKKNSKGLILKLLTNEKVELTFSYEPKSTCNNLPILNDFPTTCEDNYTYVKNIYQTYRGVDMFFPNKFQGCIKIDTESNLDFYYLNNTGNYKYSKIIKANRVGLSYYRIIGFDKDNKLFYYTIHTDGDIGDAMLAPYVKESQIQ